MSLSKRLKGMIWDLAYLSGFLALLQGVRPGPVYKGLIFYYHRVHPNPGWDPVGVTISLSLFTRQMALIKKNFPVLSLSNFFDQLKKQTPSLEENPPIVITFDDGYRDVWEYAWPVLRDFRISPALFVCTDPLIRRTPLLWDLLAQAVQEDKRKQIISSVSPLDRISPLETEEEKKIFVREMNQHLLGKSGRKQRKAFGDLSGPMAERIIVHTAKLYLQPDHVKECLRAGIEIGGHTASHPYLTFLPRQEWDYEIRESKNELEALLGTEVPFFSYPAGKWNEEVRKYVISTGYRGALATGKSVVPVSQRDFFSLPRISPEGVIAMGKFFALVSGVKKEWFH